MDEFHFELAAIVEAAQREEGVRRARELSAKHSVRPPGFCGLCTLCEEPIATGRLDAGYAICIECAEAAELEAKLYGQRLSES